MVAIQTANSTMVAPILETILGDYAAPGWLVFFAGTLLIFTSLCMVVCFKCAKCCADCNTACTHFHANCAIFCSLCTGCLIAYIRNCNLVTACYKNCVVNTYDCVTYAPAYIQAQNLRTIP